MTTLQQRKRRAEEIIKKYRSISGGDPYAAASDAIADILLFIAQDETEATQLLQCAEMDFRSELQGETFLTEG
ncbi:MAG: hypothetical protein JOY62_14445 [Acidobacteriaceae bacterium]|nr:hypothetical protein [Acidobacteriaceae bacterium]MBV9781160.1 hypothetical protein [Acidobacteriaceae bacterium]